VAMDVNSRFCVRSGVLLVLCGSLVPLLRYLSY
jgi:hypothetical protein